MSRSGKCQICDIYQDELHYLPPEEGEDESNGLMVCRDCLNRYSKRKS